MSRPLFCKSRITRVQCARSRVPTCSLAYLIVGPSHFSLLTSFPNRLQRLQIHPVVALEDEFLKVHVMIL